MPPFVRASLSNRRWSSAIAVPSDMPRTLLLRVRRSRSGQTGWLGAERQRGGGTWQWPAGRSSPPLFLRSRRPLRPSGPSFAPAIRAGRQIGRPVRPPWARLHGGDGQQRTDVSGSRSANAERQGNQRERHAPPFSASGTAAEEELEPLTENELELIAEELEHEASRSIFAAACCFFSSRASRRGVWGGRPAGQIGFPQEGGEGRPIPTPPAWKQPPTARRTPFPGIDR